jgi:hypothetical protein
MANYKYTRATPKHVAPPLEERRAAHAKLPKWTGAGGDVPFEQYDTRFGQVDGLTRPQRDENAEQLELQLAVERELAEIDAKPYRYRKPPKRSRETALAKLDRDGLAVLKSYDEQSPARATWHVRIYYTSEAGDLCAAEFGGLTEHEAEQLRGHDVQSWDSTHVHQMKHGHMHSCRRCERPIERGARFVVWPSEAARIACEQAA